MIRRAKSLGEPGAVEDKDDVDTCFFLYQIVKFAPAHFVPTHFAPTTSQLYFSRT